MYIDRFGEVQKVAVLLRIYVGGDESQEIFVELKTKRVERHQLKHAIQKLNKSNSFIFILLFF